MGLFWELFVKKYRNVIGRFKAYVVFVIALIAGLLLAYVGWIILYAVYWTFWGF
jgi:hypothetical protein